MQAGFRPIDGGLALRPVKKHHNSGNSISGRLMMAGYGELGQVMVYHCAYWWSFSPRARTLEYVHLITCLRVRSQPWPHAMKIDGAVAVWFSDNVGTSWQLADVACDMSAIGPTGHKLCNTTAKVFTDKITESVLAQLPSDTTTGAF